MRKLISYLLLTCAFISFSYSQELYDLRPFKGYYVSATLIEKGKWPISLNFMCSSLDCIYSCKYNQRDKIITNIIDSAYIIPLELIPNLSLFKYTLKTNDSKLLPYIEEYTDMYEKLFLQSRRKQNILLSDSSKLDCEYSKYYGFILCPKQDSDLYKIKIVCGSINYAEYPNIKLAIPIVSGFIKDNP